MDQLVSSLQLRHLSPEVNQYATDLFFEFRDIFTLTDERIGTYPNFYHHIPTEPGKIVRKAAYRLPYAMREPFQKEIERLLRNNVWRSAELSAARRHRAATGQVTRRDPKILCPDSGTLRRVGECPPSRRVCVAVKTSRIKARGCRPLSLILTRTTRLPASS